MHLLRLWFGLSEPVNRRSYFLSGVALMALKYALDAAVYYAVTSKLWSPSAYLDPILSHRLAGTEPMQGWLAAAHALIALPFLWIGTSMSVRRAADAGRSPWIGTLFLVPAINYVMIALLCIPRSATIDAWHPPKAVGRGPYRQEPGREPEPLLDASQRAALAGLCAALVLGVCSFLSSVYVFGDYGTALFFLTPFAMGAVTGYIHNRRQTQPLSRTLWITVVAVALCGLALLAFALEGAICILMVVPIAAVAALFGAVLGRAIASQPRRGRADPFSALAVALPVAGLLAGAGTLPAQRSVVTSVDIDAPPERIWPNVIGFSELDPPSEALFKSGIAYPVRARIEGSGVGAVRRCEFSTGAFVEPITAWDPPRRLAFDVTGEPPSMQEWSPYKHIEPPHLMTALRSKRGQFRLIPLSPRTTRLEGTTWYALDIEPASYFGVWSDLIIHAIHRRVLRHIERLSESPELEPTRR